jgi:hypothetical protein
MKNKLSWRESAWEKFLKDKWDNRPKNTDLVKYTKQEVESYLKEYTRSGQGEIRIFHYDHEKVSAVSKRGVKMIPLSRNEWILIGNSFSIDLPNPYEKKIFHPKIDLTDGMIAGIKETMAEKSNPGETTLLSIANHIGIISDFYEVEGKGVLFTGGRQKAGVHVIINSERVDISKAQIEIDGGFEWSNVIVIVEMKSSFQKISVNISQVAIPILKWRTLLPHKEVRSLILLAETNKEGIEYRAYDISFGDLKNSFSGRIEKSVLYKVPIRI